MHYDKRLFILIGELLSGATTKNSFLQTGHEEFGPISTLEELADFLNLTGNLTSRGEPWTKGNLATFCCRMRKKYPEVWDEHIPHEHLGSSRWDYLVGGTLPRARYRPLSSHNKTDNFFTPELAATWCPCREAVWMEMSLKKRRKIN